MIIKLFGKFLYSIQSKTGVMNCAVKYSLSSISSIMH